VRSCRSTTEQRYLDGTWPDERSPEYGGERSGVRTQEDSIKRRGNYLGVIMGRQDDSPEHQTLSGRTGRRALCPGALRIQGGNKGKSGRNVGSTWRPDSQLTFCASGASDAQDAAAGHQTVSGRTGRRSLCPGGVRIQGGNIGKSGRNVGSKRRPHSRLTFCASGASDAQGAQGTS